MPNSFKSADSRVSSTSIRARSTCYECSRPRTHCICTLVSPFDAHVNFLILQHPNERKKNCGTGKIVVRSIRNAKLVRGVVFDPIEVQSLLNGQKPYLLYPASDAVDCESVTLDRTSTVVVIDGTWHEARKIFLRNPLLRTFPKLTFSSPPISTYRFERQPMKHCLSTLESIALLLQRNPTGRNLADNSEECNALLRVFDQMVERQLSYSPACR